MSARVESQPAHRTRWGPAKPSGTSARPYRYAHGHQAQSPAEDPYRRHCPATRHRAAPYTAAAPDQVSHQHRERREGNSPLAQLYSHTAESRYRLFFISLHPPEKDLPAWSLIQLNLEDSGPTDARQIGKYRCRFNISNPNNVDTTPHHHCRFWPDL